MKKIAIMMALILSWVATSSAYIEAPSQNSGEASTAVEKKSKEANISFDKPSYDFGTIKEADGPVTHEFSFTNNGEAPLVIISATAGCGCTKPVFNEAPVAPGKSSVVKVTYNPKGRPGEFVKNVTVRTNDPKHKKVILKISGTVIPESK